MCKFIILAPIALILLVPNPFYAEYNPTTGQNLLSGLFVNCSILFPSASIRCRDGATKAACPPHRTVCSLRLEKKITVPSGI